MTPAEWEQLKALFHGALEQPKDTRQLWLARQAVTDEKLGEMGKPFVFEYQGQEIKLCCKSCKKDFDKEPAKYMKKLAANDKKPAKPVQPGHEGGVGTR